MVYIELCYTVNKTISIGGKIMVNTVCLTCKNWETQNCETCLSVHSSSSPRKPQDIRFKNYREIHLTPGQYHERTGKKWPSRNVVYVKVISDFATKEEIKNKNWYPLPHYETMTDNYPTVCAIGTKSPPKRWIPKKTKCNR